MALEKIRGTLKIWSSYRKWHLKADMWRRCYKDEMVKMIQNCSHMQ